MQNTNRPYYGLLSDREEQVLLLSTKGLTDKEIAKKLNLSIATVNTYWVRIRTKLGGANRAELVAAALQQNAEETLIGKETENQRLIAEIVRRAEAENALREVQAKLQGVIDGTPVLISIKDEHGRYTMVNKEFERVAGKSKDEILNRRDVDIFPMDLAEQFRGRDRHVFDSGQAVEEEIEVPSDGGVMTYLTVKFALEDANGERYGVCAFARDITPRKQAEQRYQDLFDNAPDGYLETDLEGRVLEANRKAGVLLGVPQLQLVGKEITSFLADEKSSPLGFDVKSLSKTQEVRESEVKLRPVKGSVFDAAVTAMMVRNSEGKPGTLRWMIRDISNVKGVEHELRVANDALERRVRTRTIELEEANRKLSEEVAERKNAEQDLFTNFQFTKSLIDSSLDGIFAFDRECKFTIWNKSMERMSEVKKVDVLGKFAFDVFPFLAETGEDEYFFGALRGDSATSEGKPYTSASSGKQSYFDAHYSAIRSDSGEIIGGLALVREVSLPTAVSSKTKKASRQGSPLG